MGGKVCNPAMAGGSLRAPWFLQQGVSVWEWRGWWPMGDGEQWDQHKSCSLLCLGWWMSVGHGSSGVSAGLGRIVIPLVHCIQSRKRERSSWNVFLSFNPGNLICQLLHCQQPRKKVLNYRAMDLELLWNNWEGHVLFEWDWYRMKSLFLQTQQWQSRYADWDWGCF